ncbi:putative nuclear envelope protein ndc1 [Triangularia verruculosa]|uniref:Nuclear envelope protein ndc1 n=1 Tax=Triangularia verruculosa TaxID=2587418 RepID=A0AAN6XKW2_9PEZI|nr:putative nuclear envelope protein ndc1 [Triangularia verruculosa]
MAGATAAKVRVLPYKDFLQPALQRRFATSGLVILVIAYLEALILSSWESFLWAWFPIGPAGFRTFCFFVCGVLIIVLRIAQHHPGARTTSSPLATFLDSLRSFNTLETILTYAISAWGFSQVYLWCMSEDAGLEYISYYHADRARLNEKTVFLTTHCVLVGVWYGAKHLFQDVDRLKYGIAKPQSADGNDDDKDSNTQLQRLAQQLPEIVVETLTQALTSTTFSMVAYALFLRGFVWRFTMSLFRPVYNLPRTNMTPHTLPFSLPIILRCLWTSVLLTFVWTLGNQAFSLFMVKNPLKNNKPLTSESKDPNGSLLNGLKAKKLSIQCFAMWELAYIARDFQDRRKAIYEDIDRKNGPMWSQVYKICIDTLKQIEERIDNYNKYGKPAPPPPELVYDNSKVTEKKRLTQTVPKEEDVFEASPQRRGFREAVERTVSKVVTDPGQPSQLSPAARRFAERAKDELIKAQKQATGREDTEGLAKDFATKFLESPLGWPFRRTYRRKMAGIVLGGPYGEASLYANAAFALSGLAVSSLQEDKYGNVQRDVAELVRVLTGLVRKIEELKGGVEVSWTDTEGRRDCEEVEEVLEALRWSLRGLLGGFGVYARELRLGLGDVRRAREAAGVEGEEGEMGEVYGRVR